MRKLPWGGLTTVAAYCKVGVPTVSRWLSLGPPADKSGDLRSGLDRYIVDLERQRQVRWDLATAQIDHVKAIQDGV